MRKKIDLNSLLHDLNNIDNKVLPSQNFNNWELDFLIDYIVQTYHVYVLEDIELLDAYSVKVAKVHSDHHPTVIEIERLYSIVKIELLQHMQKEERIWFPYTKQMVKAKNENVPMVNSHFGTVQNPINIMQAEHENAGDVLKEIASLIMSYTPPEWACNTFKALYAKLDEFEQDLHIHVHLENNIIFPKAFQIEKAILN